MTTLSVDSKISFSFLIKSHLTKQHFSPTTSGTTSINAGVPQGGKLSLGFQHLPVLSTSHSGQILIFSQSGMRNGEQK